MERVAGCRLAARRAGIHPKVIDDIAWAQLTDPPLTTVSIDAESPAR
jgi:DNA-binding LacI/PurR family transcriptional regulator